MAKVIKKEIVPVKPEIVTEKTVEERIVELKHEPIEIKELSLILNQIAELNEKITEKLGNISVNNEIDLTPIVEHNRQIIEAIKGLKQSPVNVEKVDLKPLSDALKALNKKEPFEVHFDIVRDGRGRMESVIAKSIK